MLIKVADDKRARLAQLEAAMQGSKHAKEAFYILKAGIKGEADSAYLIDFHYGEVSRNWAVIHDLRLEHGGRVAQIDHVLINRFLEVYALETKHFNSGVKITEEGEFLRWNDWRRTYEGMASPIAQNERHISVLREVFKTLPLPERFGLRLQPSFVSYVLVSERAKIQRPKRFDTRQVIKADQLKQRIEREFDETNPLLVLAKSAKIIAPDTLEAVASALAKLHRPLEQAEDAPHESAQNTRAANAVAVPAAITPAPAVLTPRALSGPACKACGNGGGTILYGQYGYYFKCAACDANTSIRFTCQPGHRPKLRKAGSVFFRDCGECGTSEPYHANPSAA
jgi:hypothetical protein